MGKQDARLCIGEHGVQARGWIVWIQRQVSRAGFERRQQGDDQVDAARQAYGHAVFRHHAQCDQVVGELVGARVERGVVQGVRRALQGGVPGRALRLCCERLVHVWGCRRYLQGVVHCVQHAFALGQRQQR